MKRHARNLGTQDGERPKASHNQNLSSAKTESRPTTGSRSGVILKSRTAERKIAYLAG